MPIQTHPNKITIFVFFGFIVFFLFCIFWEGEKVSKRLCTESAFTVHGIPWLVRWTGMVCFPDHSLPSCFGGFLGVGHKLLSWLCYLRLNWGSTSISCIRIGNQLQSTAVLSALGLLVLPNSIKSCGSTSISCFSVCLWYLSAFRIVYQLQSLLVNFNQLL